MLVKRISRKITYGFSTEKSRFQTVTKSVRIETSNAVNSIQKISARYFK